MAKRNGGDFQNPLFPFLSAHSGKRENGGFFICETQTLLGHLEQRDRGVTQTLFETSFFIFNSATQRITSTGIGTTEDKKGGVASLHPSTCSLPGRERAKFPRYSCKAATSQATKPQSMATAIGIAKSKGDPVTAAIEVATCQTDRKRRPMPMPPVQ